MSLSILKSRVDEIEGEPHTYTLVIFCKRFKVFVAMNLYLLVDDKTGKVLTHVGWSEIIYRPMNCAKMRSKGLNAKQIVHLVASNSKLKKFYNAKGAYRFVKVTPEQRLRVREVWGHNFRYDNRFPRNKRIKISEFLELVS